MENLKMMMLMITMVQAAATSPKWVNMRERYWESAKGKRLKNKIKMKNEKRKNDLFRL